MTDWRLRISAACLAAIFSLPAWAQSWQPNAAMLALYEKAKPEKEVVIWAPAAVEAGWVPDQFAKRFPGIEVKPTADLQAATKIIAESRAGRHSVDAWSFTIGGMIEVQKRDLMLPVDWARYGIAKDNVFFGGQAAATHNFLYVSVYAKTALTPADLPKRWDDLLQPHWKGKLTAQAFLLPRLMGFLALEWGEERTAKWGRALIDDQKMLITSTPAESLLKSGERVLAVGESVSLAYQYAADGVDSGYQIMDLVPAGQFAVSVLKDAPHPNAALLLAAWLASDEGKEYYETLVHQPDIRPGSTSAFAHEIAAAKAKPVLEDVANMDQRADYYKNFSALVRGQN
jgi:iron(III) transport system substrate-binding protein